MDDLKKRMRKKVKKKDFWERSLEILNTKPVIGALIFIILGLSMVIAGDVVVRQGALEVDDDFNVSGVLFVDSTNGLVGIGTASPATELHLSLDNGATPSGISSDDILITKTGTAQDVIFEGIGNVSRSVWYAMGDEDARLRGYIKYSNADDELSFAANSTVVMTLDPEGDVGIGEASPSFDLQFSSNTFGLNAISAAGGPVISSAGSMRFMIDSDSSSSGSGFVWYKDADPLSSAGTTLLSLLESGNLIITGEIKVADTNTGGSAGTHICIDGNNKFCQCGSCAA